MKRRNRQSLDAAAAIVLTLTLAAGLAHSESALAQRAAPHELGASSWALVDPETGRYLDGENPDERRAPAATANIMTALVALESAEDLHSEVVVTKEAERYVGFTYSNVGLIAGEQLSVRELLQAAMISSGTDATYTLAEHMGYGDTQRFVDRMNAKARELGLENTHFTNPLGLDEEGNYSSARDLAVIGRETMRDPRFADMVSTQEATISTQNREIELFNTNELLYAYPVSTGIKTGSSPHAGPSVVASAEDDGRSYIAVVLGTDSAQGASGDARGVLQYGFDTYESQPLVREGEEFTRLPLPYKKGQEVTLVAGEKVEALAGPGSEIEHRTSAREAPESAPAGERLGSVRVLVDGVEVGESPLVTAESYLRPSVWDKARLAALWPIERLADSLRRYAG